MTSMVRTGPRFRAAARVLAVLAVLLGLVAMHGLASTHHAAAATPLEQHEPTQHHAEAPTSSAPASPGCDDDCSGLAVLCVAVLAGAALLARLLTRRRTPLLLTTRRHPHAALRAPPVTHARGPDPVKELCVSRT